MITITAISTEELNSPWVKLDELLLLLPDSSREKLAGYLNMASRDRSLIGELLIRYCLVKYAGLPQPAIQFTTGENGKPLLSGNEGVHFNMSHSGKIVVCAVADTEIGVDVEEVRKVNYRVAERFFSAGELADLMEMQEPEKQSYFFKLWTIKESFLKAIGKGLTRSLNTFTVQKKAKGFSLIGDALSESFHVQSWQLPDNYLLACCCQEDAFPLQVKWIQIEELLKTLA